MYRTHAHIGVGSSAEPGYATPRGWLLSPRIAPSSTPRWLILLQTLCARLAQFLIWPPGLWFNGRVWLMQQRLLALARLPIGLGSLRSDPYQRAPAEHLWELVAICGVLAFLSLACQGAL